MVNKMENKSVILLTCIGICFMILVPTLYKVITNHRERLLLVTTKRIEEAALLCYREESCKTEEISLKELYEQGYLEKEYDPITKEYYDENKTVFVTLGEAKFNAD